MRGISLGLLAVLAMSSVALAAPVLDYEVSNYQPGLGMRTLTVYATGLNINTLSEFYVGGVHQVWTAPGTYSEWAYLPTTTPANALDSHVLFGNGRFADLPGIPGYPSGPSVTKETVPSGTSGLGTLENLSVGTPGSPGYIEADAYVKWGVPADNPNERVDLFQLVVPQGQSVTLTATLHSALFNPDNPPYYDKIETYRFDNQPGGLGSLVITSYWDGDTDKDGDVDFVDFDNFASGWFGATASWGTGDFNNDGVIDFVDFDLFATGWFGPAGSGYTGGAALPEGAAAGGTAIPEPGTLVMLVLGCLCLASYRLRK